MFFTHNCPFLHFFWFFSANIAPIWVKEVSNESLSHNKSFFDNKILIHAQHITHRIHAQVTFSPNFCCKCNFNIEIGIQINIQLQISISAEITHRWDWITHRYTFLVISLRILDRFRSKRYQMKAYLITNLSSIIKF